jgi:hypothetical protein
MASEEPYQLSPRVAACPQNSDSCLRIIIHGIAKVCESSRLVNGYDCGGRYLNSFHAEDAEKKERTQRGPGLPSASSLFPLRPLRETFFSSVERYRTTTVPFMEGCGSQW